MCHQEVKKHSVRYIRIDGSTPATLRDGYRKQFQEERDVQARRGRKGVGKEEEQGGG